MKTGKSVTPQCVDEMESSSTSTNLEQQVEDQSGRYGGEAWTKIVSASVGSAITAFAVTPLEVVKVRQQAAGFTMTGGSSTLPPPARPAALPCPGGCGTFVLNTGLGEYLTSRNKAGYFDPKTGALKQEASVAEVLKTGGPLRIIRSIFVHEGLAGIYAGLAPTLVMGIPNTVLYFYTYEELAMRLQGRYPSDHSLGGGIPAVAGASARFVASLSTAPLELLRTQQAARAGLGTADSPNGGMISEFRSIIRNDGVFSLFRGVKPTLMRDVPFSAIYWASIEKMRDFWKARHHDRTSSVSTTEQTMEALINGSVSGIVAAGFTTPLDVLKTRSQITIEPAATVVAETTTAVGVSQTAMYDHGGALAVHPKAPSAGPKTSSTLQTARDIVKEEGITGLWRGNIARCMKVAPACGIMIATYEAGKRILTID